MPRLAETKPAVIIAVTEHTISDLCDIKGIDAWPRGPLRFPNRWYSICDRHFKRPGGVWQTIGGVVVHDSEYILLVLA